ncbi:MAG: hypothetical protein WBH65_06080, partial [Dethiobacteria bacterium]
MAQQPHGKRSNLLIYFNTPAWLSQKSRKNNNRRFIKSPRTAAGLEQPSFGHGNDPAAHVDLH